MTYRQMFPPKPLSPRDRTKAYFTILLFILLAILAGNL